MIDDDLEKKYFNSIPDYTADEIKQFQDLSEANWLFRPEETIYNKRKTYNVYYAKIYIGVIWEWKRPPLSNLKDRFYVCCRAETRQLEWQPNQKYVHSFEHAVLFLKELCGL